MVVISGGTPPAPGAAVLVPSGALVIAADRGVDHALSLGVVPDLAVGDFDSVSPDGLARLHAAGIPLHRHPTDKDATDLELALDVALEAGARRLIVIGGDGGRLDHLLASVAVLGRPAHADIAVEAHLGGHRVDVVHPGRVVSLRGDPAAVVTLLACGGPATGVTTTGLRFALRGDTLDAWSSRGVSNEFTEAHASVSVQTGVVLAITPEQER